MINSLPEISIKFFSELAGIIILSSISWFVCEYFQHFGNKNIPETSCSNALEGLLHHGCWLSLPGPLWLSFYIIFVVHLLF